MPRYAYTGNSFNNTISQFIVDGKAGRLIPNGLAAVGQFPSAVAVHPSGKYVFATAQAPAQLHVYFLDDATGWLHEVPGSPIDTGVASPFAITFDQSGRHVYIAGRTSNNITGFAFNADTAQLTPMKGMPVETGASRTRQFVVHPSGRYLYSVNVYSDTISGFRIDPDSGMLSQLSGSPYGVGKAPVDILVAMEDIPEGITQAPYNIQVHPSGKYVFVCNWMSASVSVFKVNPSNGELTLVEGSPFKSDPHPYDLIVSPDGRYLYSAHWAMNTLVGFKIDVDTGKLTRLNPKGMNTQGQGPVDMWFDNADDVLYVANYFTHNIASYRYDAGSGALALIGSTPTRFGPRSLSMVYGEEPVRLASHHLYGISKQRKLLFAYGIDEQTGELLPQASFNMTAEPVALAFDRVNNLVYVATNHPDQIHVFSLKDGATFESRIQAPVEVKETPSSIATGPDGLIVYTTSAEHDRMLVFERHPQTGEIKEWPESPRSTESYPTQVKIDPAGRFAFVLNEKSNVISSYRFRAGLWPLVDQVAMTDKMGKDDRQFTAMSTDPLGNFIYAADAHNNEIVVKLIDGGTGVFMDAKASDFKVGAKPVDITFHPSGRWVYVVNNEDSTVNTFAVDNLSGKFEKKLQTLKTSISPVNIKLDASGRFAYVVYNGSKTLSMYSIDAAGLLHHKKDVNTEAQIDDVVIDSAIE